MIDWLIGAALAVALLAILYRALNSSPVPLPPATEIDDDDPECEERDGRLFGWSPKRDIAAALEHETLDEARLELAAATAELKPMLDDFHAAMAKAWRAFDAGMLAPMARTAAWHAQAGDCCQRCAQQRAEQFGPIGERFGIRSFRINTDTAEYRIYNPHEARELVHS